MKGTGKTFWAFTRYYSYELSKRLFVSSEKVFLIISGNLNIGYNLQVYQHQSWNLINKLTFVLKREFFLTFPYKFNLNVWM